MTVRSIGQCLRFWVDRKPDETAIVVVGDELSWRDLDRQSNRLARDYRARGVKAGNYVSIALPNGLDFYRALFAIWKLGATPQPLSWRMPVLERDELLDLVAPTLVVGSQDTRFPSVPVGHVPSAALSDAPLEDLVSPHWKAVASGGSTGRPKIIVSADPGAFDPEAPDYMMTVGGTQLVAGPLYHNAALIFSSLGLFRGNRIVVMERFDAETALALIDRHKVMWMVLVPTMMQRMLRLDPAIRARYDITSVRTLLHTASACPAWVKRGWIDWIGADALYEGYGGTEGNGATIVRGDDWLRRPGTVGCAPPGWEIRVTGDDGTALPPGTIGEIWMRQTGDARPPFFYLGASATEAKEGWESLGDLGHLDADGYLFIADRRTDLIVSGGANIYPAEVEAAIDAMPGVRTSAVIGLPDDDLGARVHAIVDAPDGLDVEALLAHLALRLARNKVPRSIELVDAPLRDDAGKTRRSALRESRLAALERA